MKRFAFLAGISVLAISLFTSTASAGNGPRIELDQTSPSVGDTVTFTVTTPSGAKEINLVCGPDAAYYPAQQAVQNETKPVGSEFVVNQEGTCVAWLLKRGTPVVGTLFWVFP